MRASSIGGTSSMAVPRLANVELTRIKFEPGDRVLVRVHSRIDPEARRRLRAVVERWAGGCVEVLVYCPLDFDVEVDRHGRI